MNEEIIRLLAKLVKELLNKNYIFPNGKFNRTNRYSGFPIFAYLGSEHGLLTLDGTESNIKDLLKKGCRFWLCYEHESSSYDWFKCNETFDKWYAESTKIPTELVKESIEITAKLYEIDLYYTSLDKAADLLADDEFDDI